MLILLMAHLKRRLSKVYHGFFIFIVNCCISGFYTLTQELTDGVKYWNHDEQKERIAALRLMFPNLADQNKDIMKSITAKYHEYKRDYVKHMSFNPDDENLSKCFS